jgi:putative nucleotidyltransferase with HDIG domain
MLEACTGGRKCALVVDDEPVVRQMVGDVLEREGFAVYRAAGGYEVSELLRKHDVDLLLCDIVMPGMSGLELAGVVRELSPSTSTIMMTGKVSIETARGATRCGADDYLPKPFTTQELLRCVRSALRRRARDRERSRRQELAKLYQLSEDVREATNPWEMLRLTGTAALLHTHSDVGYLATYRAGLLWPLPLGLQETGGTGPALPPDDLLHACAVSQRPILVTGESDHPLSATVSDVRSAGRSVLDPVVEAIIVPLASGRDEGGALALGRREARSPYTLADYELVSVLGAQCNLLLRNADLLTNLERSYVGSIQAMVRTIEARDRYTHGHSRRVAALCWRLAEALEISPADRKALRTAADLHDIGKLAVPDQVLNKPGPLDDGEWQLVRRHPAVGAEVLAPATFLNDIQPLILSHHERFDGKGYPRSLMGGRISSLGHILIVADAWDAMTSDRPYREALSTERALREIEAGAGRQFDPAVAEALMRVLAPRLR